MSDRSDDDCPKVRAAFGHLLRSHVRHQDGRHSLAPTVVFADYDYDIDDGKCGLCPDAKNANEPAIVYVRADALIDARDRIEAQADEIARLREYRRADLPPTPAQIAADERVRGLYRNAEYLAREVSVFMRHNPEAASKGLIRDALEKTCAALAALGEDG